MKATETPESEAQTLERERDELLEWKREAIFVLKQWDLVWEAAGSPGNFGDSKAESVRKLLRKKTNDY